jgi:hypothetical protein
MPARWASSPVALVGGLGAGRMGRPWTWRCSRDSREFRARYCMQEGGTARIRESNQTRKLTDLHPRPQHHVRICFPLRSSEPGRGSQSLVRENSFGLRECDGNGPSQVSSGAVLLRWMQNRTNPVHRKQSRRGRGLLKHLLLAPRRKK